MTDIMQERAAKVAKDEFESLMILSNRAESVGQDDDAARIEDNAIIANRIYKKIVALSPDPTRAALEECVMAMDEVKGVLLAAKQAIKSLPEDALGFGERQGDDGLLFRWPIRDELVTRLKTVALECGEALATARNALQEE